MPTLSYDTSQFMCLVPHDSNNQYHVWHGHCNLLVFLMMVELETNEARMESTDLQEKLCLLLRTTGLALEQIIDMSNLVQGDPCR